MTWRPSIFFVLVSMASQLAVGQSPGSPAKINVGDAIVNGSSLKPYKNLWRMSRISQSGKLNPDVGQWTDQLEFVKIDGRACLQRTQVASFKKDGQIVATTRTVNVFDPKTLAPVSRSFLKHFEKGGDETTQVTFSPKTIRMEQTKEGKTNSQDVKLDAPVFDFYGGLYGLLLATFPLKSGFSATLPSVNEDDPAISWVTFNVTGQKTADAGPKGKMETWVVESDTNLGPMKFWISADAPYIIRLEYTAKDNGTKWIYQMI